MFIPLRLLHHFFFQKFDVFVPHWVRNLIFFALFISELAEAKISLATCKAKVSWFSAVRLQLAT